MPTAELVLSVSGFITAVLAAIGALYSSRRSARKDEVTLLREEVARLQRRVSELSASEAAWRTGYAKLYGVVLHQAQENAWLRIVLAQHHIDIPPMPEGFACENLAMPEIPEGANDIPIKDKEQRQ